MINIMAFFFLIKYNYGILGIRPIFDFDIQET